jgi:hypothetical protein
MPLPTMSLRAAPEHHQLIRDIATALRSRSELVDMLCDVLQAQHIGIAPVTQTYCSPSLSAWRMRKSFHGGSWLLPKTSTIA